MGLTELKEKNSKGKIVAPHGLCIGRGRDLTSRVYDNSSVEDMIIPVNARSKHLGCMGTTQIGKSRLIELMVKQDIKMGLNIVVINPKGDLQLNAGIIEAAVEAGRIEDLMFLDPIFPDTSIMIDPLTYYFAQDEIVDHITSGIKAKDEYFINVSQEIATVIVTAHIMLAKARGNSKVTLNFLDIKAWSSYQALKKLKESLELLKNNADQEIRNISAETVDNIQQILDSPQDFFAKVASSLRTTLTALTSGATGKIIGKAKSNEFIKRLEEGKRVILICNTGSMLARRTAHTVGRVLTSMIQSLIGRIYLAGRTIEPPLSVYFDEGHNVLYIGQEELYNKGGSANVYLHFFTQSLAQMEEAVGEKITQSIIDNIHQWIYMKVNHTKTAEFVEMSTPLKKMYETTNTMSGGKISMQLRQGEERMVLREKILSLQPQWFYMKAADGRFFKGKVSNVKQPYVSLLPPAMEVI